MHSEKRYFIMRRDGSIFDPKEYYQRFSNREFNILIEKEIFKKEYPEAYNPVTDLCRKFGFEWEKLSDYGHMRYHPHAYSIVELASLYSLQIIQKVGIPILLVKGTNMFDLSNKAIKEHAVLFGDRLYTLKVDDRSLVLRYAACHQQFSIMRDYTFSYRDLPLGFFEIADSYRLEQTGEIALCFRPRRFFMPDLHILVKNIDEAVNVAHKLQEIIHTEAEKIGQTYYPVYNVTEDLWKEGKDILRELIKYDKKDAIITLYPKGIYYWILNVEYHIIDNIGRAREIATFQFDIGNAKRFNITYTDRSNRKQFPIIIHTALIGSIERYIYMIFDKLVKDMKNNKIARLPTWLSPIQARVIPVSITTNLINYSNTIHSILSDKGIRADIDDREISLRKKIKEAHIEMIPYIIIIGEKELIKNKLRVRYIKAGEIKEEEMNLNYLIKLIESDIGSNPRSPLKLPSRLSRRPNLYYIYRDVKV